MNQILDKLIESKSQPIVNYVRLGLAAVLIVLAAFLKVPAAVVFILLLLSTLISSYDIIFAAVDDVSKQNFFSHNLILLLIIVIGFAIGHRFDVASSMVIYQVGKIITDVVIGMSKASAMDLLKYQDEGTHAALAQILDDEEATELKVKSVINSSADLVLKIAMGFAVLYAILIPIITNYSFSVSLHRAIAILFITTPVTMTVASSVVAAYSLCHAGQLGVVFKKGSALEDASDVSTVIFDKAGIFTAESPRVISIECDKLDKKTFMNFAAHAVYYSDQPVATAISNYSPTKDYILDIISEFREIPGRGVQLKINNLEVILATADVFLEKGISIPQSVVQSGTVYFMTLSGKYVGNIVISDDYNTEALSLVSAMREEGIKKCVLLTEDNKSQTEKIADELGFDAHFSDCSAEKKRKIIEDVANKATHSVMFVYSNGIEEHSAADIDVRVNHRGRYADGIVDPEFLTNLPSIFKISQRLRTIMLENAIFAFAVKAVLIFLAINGFTTIWFAALIDAIAGLATVLNACRVPGDDLINTLRNR